MTVAVDGPRVLSNMALDRWFPAKFAMLSDRLVTQNGILLMGGAGLLLIVATDGSVDLLIVLYSLNVFITFVLSQLGMVRHWWKVRGQAALWRKGLCLNGLGFILIMVTAVKFDEGGWVTLLITGGLAALALGVNRHYRRVHGMIKNLDGLCEVMEADGGPAGPCVAMTAPGGQAAKLPEAAEAPRAFDPQAATAVVFVNGYNGLGVHTLLSVVRLFGRDVKNYVFVQIGVVDAGVFKGAAELSRLKGAMEKDLRRYEAIMRRRGYYAESLWAVGTDIVHEVLELAPAISERFPRAIFFGGQIVFEHESLLTRLLHNYVVFTLQRQFYRMGLPFMIMPILLDGPRQERGEESVPAEA